ncbi:MAG TPA: peptide-methionine (S)-S-oxide reductase, partial [Clostridia bacterium]|nr:peptide-methionine (S)-S-oxide reductase [Clostridia bacterium]
MHSRVVYISIFIFLFAGLVIMPLSAGGSQENRAGQEAGSEEDSADFMKTTEPGKGNENSSLKSSGKSSGSEKEIDPFSEAELQYLEPYDTAVFAGGCFWCLEQPFEQLVGVAEVISGFTGGSKEDPTYRQVVSGTTDHRESVIVYYNRDVISYEQLLQVFWRNIDPTDPGGQFVDR